MEHNDDLCRPYALARLSLVRPTVHNADWQNRDGATDETCYALPMFGLFKLFGQSPALNALDDGLRAHGLHPLLVPDAVKLTVVRLHKEEARARGMDAAYYDAAELLAYCMHGRKTFLESNSANAADHAEHRVEAAIDAGDSRDAKLIILALHAGIIAPEIADRLDIEDQ